MEFLRSELNPLPVYEDVFFSEIDHNVTTGYLVGERVILWLNAG